MDPGVKIIEFFFKTDALNEQAQVHTIIVSVV